MSYQKTPSQVFTSLNTYRPNQYLWSVVETLAPDASSTGALPAVVLASIWALFVVVVNHAGLPLHMPDRLSTLMGVAIAFMLGFRTNRAFDRYWFAAQQWTTMTLHVRACARSLYLNHQTAFKSQDMLKVLLAATLATKLGLRGTSGRHDQQISVLIPRDFTDFQMKRFGKQYNDSSPLHLPVELLLYIESLLATLKNLPDQKSHISHIAGLSTSLEKIVDCIARFELVY